MIAKEDSDVHDEPAVYIRTVQIRETGQVAASVPEEFKSPDLDRITSVTREIVERLQAGLIETDRGTGGAPPETKKLAAQSLEVEFGIDFGVEVEGEAKIPIIGPKVRGGAHGSATFAMKIVFERV
jgi:hypothetical protein